jgi:hypothetical protein
MFHAFGDGPSVGRGLEIPLSFAEAFGRCENAFFAALE